MAGLTHGVAAAERHGCRVLECSRTLLLFATVVLQHSLSVGLRAADPPAPPVFTGRAPAATAPAERPPAAERLPERPENLKWAVSAGIPQVVVDRRSWHQSLLRDRKLELSLRSATRQLQAGDLAQALTSFQQVLDRGEDGFVRTESEHLPRGAHWIVSSVLSSLSSDGLQLYETLQGAEARRLLAQAFEKDDIPLCSEVARRFFHTAAGFDAADRLATRWMDHGSYTLAAAWWQRLLSEPVHVERIRPHQRLKAAVCFQRTGQYALARQMTKLLGDTPLTIAGRSQRADEWLTRLATASAATAADGSDGPEASIVGNGFDRNGVVDGSAPLLGRPVWSIDLTEDPTRHLDQYLTNWETYQSQNGLPLGTSQFPLAVGDQIVFRDFAGLRAVDLKTGAVRWRYRCNSALARDIPVQSAATQEGNPDPGNISRLHVGNHTLGMLSSDGRRVFFVDNLESRWNQQNQNSNPANDVAAQSRQTNQLVALDPAQNSSPGATETSGQAVTAPLWVAGGAVETGGVQPGGAPRSLAGHFFLGAPLPVENRLYAVSEANQALHVSCLQPETGRVEWSQEICLVSTPIHADQQRYYLSCSPGYADGVLVCPTHSGLLVGLNPLSGQLLWAYSYDDPDLVQQLGAWPNSVRHMFGHKGYPNLPLIQSGRVVYLPPHSEEIHCVDLQSGTSCWKGRRQDLEQAMEYVAAATPESVLIVGRLRCRGLSLATGEELWSMPLRSSPSGRGVRLGPSYLLPLAEGAILNIDVATGKRLGFALPDANFRPGNLVVGGKMVVSLGLRGVTALPQASAMLSEMHPILRETPMSPEQSLLAAELELAIGQVPAGRRRLQELLDQAPNVVTAQAAEQLLRELLFTEIAQDRKSPDEALLQLASLVRTPEQRARLLIERAEHAQEQGDRIAVLKAARELVELNLTTSLTLERDPSRTIAVDNRARQLLTDQRRRLGDGFLELEQQIHDDLDAALRAADVPQLRRLVGIYADWPAAETARLSLAQLLAARGEYQEAELLLVNSRTSLNPKTAGEATRLLAELWEERGVYHEAGQLLNEVATRFVDVEVAPGRTGASYLSSYPRDRLSWHAFRRVSPPAWSLSSVKISEQRWPDMALMSTYSTSGSQPLILPRGSSFDLFDKGRGVGGSFTVVDRHSGVEFPEPIKVPARYYFPNSSQNSFVNHFFPLGTLGAAHGVSLLDRQITWTTAPEGLKNRSDIVRVGPAGPGFCTFQCRQHLFALDPRDGRLLWHRQDLEGLTGLMIDPSTGLIGDAHVLLLFAGDRAHYTVYDTVTGEELRRGKLDIDRRAPRRAFGRRLFHITGTGGNKRLRIWDPLTDRCLWDEPAENLLDASTLAGMPQGTKAWSIVHNADELALVTREGELRVIDANTGETRLNVRVAPEYLENLGLMKVFGDQERYYVNLQRIMASGEVAPQTSFITSDATIPMVHVQGDVFGIDRKTQSVLWQRSFGNRSIVQLSEYSLPVSLTVCRIRRGNQLASQVEVISNHTGDVLASHDALLADRILQVFYERDPGRIELQGAKTSIRVEFAAAREAPQAELLREIRRR